MAELVAVMHTIDVPSVRAGLEVTCVTSWDDAWFAEQAALYSSIAPRQAITGEELGAFRLYLGTTLELVVRDEAGELVATASAGFRRDDPDERFGWIGVDVRGDVDPDGLDESLADAVLTWATGRSPERIEVGGWEDQPRELDLWKARGFVEHSRNAQLELQLGDIERPDTSAPPGVTITTIAERPELLESVYDIWLEGLTSIPGQDAESLPDRATWIELVRHMPMARDEARWIALDGADEIIGYTSFVLPAARADVAHHGLLAVTESRRGEGIGRALKHTAVAWALDEGFRICETDNEERNEAILALNTRLGYQPTPPFVLLRWTPAG